MNHFVDAVLTFEQTTTVLIRFDNDTAARSIGVEIELEEADRLIALLTVAVREIREGRGGSVVNATLDLDDIETQCAFDSMTGSCGYRDLETATADILRLVAEVRRLRVVVDAAIAWKHASDNLFAVKGDDDSEAVQLAGEAVCTAGDCFRAMIAAYQTTETP